VRVLFFNEGNLGSHVMGQGQLVEALRTGLEQTPEIDARFAGLTPMGRLAAALATRAIPPLARRRLDMRALRWHLVQSTRANRAIAGELARWPAEVVHVHSQSVALTPGRTLRATATVLSVDSTIGDWSAMPAWRGPGRLQAALVEPSRALERRAFARAKLTVAWTRWARRSVERTAPGARVEELHPGIDLDRYRPAPRRERERPRVLFVGGRFAEKGGPDLLAALAGELGQSVDLDLVTPAPVPERPGVRVHRLGPSDPQLLELQQQADLLCLPSYGDAVPWAILEAMACGTPVLSTRVGGIPDLLDDGRCGALIECGDARALGDSLRSLLGDDRLRRTLAGRARERCEQRYDARRQVPLLVERMRGLRSS
jgi:glycosyltransferase involved in cell wall biosynthesis